MEVAVIRFNSIASSGVDGAAGDHSISKSASLVRATVFGAALLIGLAGCGTDMITFSHDSQAKGMQQYNDGDYADAAGSLANSVRQDPTNYTARYYLGQSYENTAQPHLAIEQYQQCLLEMRTTLAGRSDVILHDKACDALVNLVAKVNDSDSEVNFMIDQANKSRAAEDYCLVAPVFRQRGDADSALQYYNQAVLSDPQDFPAQKQYGLYLAQLGQNDRAADPLRAAYRLNQKDDQVNNALVSIGMPPGPSLLEENQLAQPLIPRGPIPSPLAPSASSDSNNPHD
jgi:Tfp pilus assembly protein PilF